MINFTFLNFLGRNYKFSSMYNSKIEFPNFDIKENSQKVYMFAAFIQIF